MNSTQATIKYHAPIPPLATYYVTVDTQHDGKKWITIKQTFLSAPPPGTSSANEDQTVLPFGLTWDHSAPSSAKEPTIFAEMELTAVVKHWNGKTVSPTALVEASDAAIAEELLRCARAGEEKGPSGGGNNGGGSNSGGNGNGGSNSGNDGINSGDGSSGMKGRWKGVKGLDGDYDDDASRVKKEKGACAH